MRRLRVRKVARAEILAAFEWYLERSPAAAERFMAAVDDAMRRIEEAPEFYPLIRGQLTCQPRQLAIPSEPQGPFDTTDEIVSRDRRVALLQTSA